MTNATTPAQTARPGDDRPRPSRPLRVLYVGMKHDHGKPELGLAFEHWNFFHTMHRMGLDIAYFDFAGIMARRGQAGMNARLAEVARAHKPDLMFTVLFQDEIDPNVVSSISRDTGTLTFNWFCDDHWRFEDFTRRWAPRFSWCVTTARSALPKYEKIGYRNVIKSQWAANPYLYRRLDLPMKHEVTFVGRPHGTRRQTISAIREAGFDVKTWGPGWDTGWLDQDQMIEVFNTSRINLNLSNASVPVSTPMRRLKKRVKKVLTSVGLGSAATAAARVARGGVKAQDIVHNPKDYQDQIKGRNFEIPGCGGFTLTGTSEDLDSYYTPGREVVTVDGSGPGAGIPETVRLIRHYLEREDERRAIADAGYARTRAEHTYVHRFVDAFSRMGLAVGSAESYLRDDIAPGRVEEIE
jgi:spore maturation protein CgeB